MGGQAEGLACADPEARTPIGASGILSCYTKVGVCSTVAAPLLLDKEGDMLEEAEPDGAQVVGREDNAETVIQLQLNLQL